MGFGRVGQKAVGVVLSLLALHLHAETLLPPRETAHETPAFLKKLKREYDAKTNDANAMDVFRNRYGFLAQKRADTEVEGIESIRRQMRFDGSAISRLAESMGVGLDEASKRALMERMNTLHEKSSARHRTVFYLFTTNQGEVSIQRFMEAATKLKEVMPQWRAYGVLRGFPKGVNIKRFFDRHYTEERSGFVLKVHPFIFRELGIERAPAYLFSECPDDFRFRDCTNEYVVRGDISLAEALKVVSDANASFKRDYISFIEGFSDVDD